MNLRMNTFQHLCVMKERCPKSMGKTISQPLFQEDLRKLVSKRESTCIARLQSSLRFAAAVDWAPSSALPTAYASRSFH